MPGPYMQVNDQGGLHTYGSPRKHEVSQIIPTRVSHWTAEEYADYRAFLMRRMRSELFEGVFKEHDVDGVLIVYGKNTETDFITRAEKITLTARVWEQEI